MRIEIMTKDCSLEIKKEIQVARKIAAERQIKSKELQGIDNRYAEAISAIENMAEETLMKNIIFVPLIPFAFRTDCPFGYKVPICLAVGNYGEEDLFKRVFLAVIEKKQDWDGDCRRCFKECEVRTFKSIRGRLLNGLITAPEEEVMSKALEMLPSFWKIYLEEVRVAEQGQKKTEKK